MTMKIGKCTLLLFVFFYVITAKTQIKYPTTSQKPVVESYHNTKIIDQYKWLEDLNSPEVEQWIKAQNNVSLKFLKKISRRNFAKSKMRSFNWYANEDKRLIAKKNDKKYYYKLLYPGENSLPNIYYKKGIKTSYEKLISARSISSKDDILFSGLFPSNDDRYLAYTYSRNGSDWKELKIVGVKKRKFFKEVIIGIRYPQIEWYGQGFYYLRTSVDKTKGVKRNSIMYHKLGTPQSADRKILTTSNENEELSIVGNNKQSFYAIKKSNRLKNRFSYFEMKNNEGNIRLNPIFFNSKYNLSLVKFEKDTILVKTSIKNKKCIVKFPLNKPKQWKILTPTYEKAVFVDYELVNEKIVTAFQTETSSFLTITDMNGNLLNEVSLPEGLGINSLYFNDLEDEFFFRLSSYTIPPVVCKLDMNSYKYEYIGKPEVLFDAKKYRFMKKKFVSFDGTEVPIFIVYKDSIRKDGKTPFLMNTYGGYGNIAKPSYNPGVIYFIENGGAFAYIHIRGGGEFGYNWWQDGKGLKKKNGIIDFTKAAEFLIKERLARPENIGITGSSHGGLISAAAMTMRPELFAAAVINVGALDMIGMQNTFTGSSYVNINEFGDVKKEEDFKNIYSYSPYHQIKDSVNYPSTLLITGTDDTRVPAYQSFKFAAKLQNGKKQKNPILLWTQKNRGHFGAEKYNRYIEEQIFIYGFLLKELNKNLED